MTWAMTAIEDQVSEQTIRVLTLKEKIKGMEAKIEGARLQLEEAKRKCTSSKQLLWEHEGELEASRLKV